MAYWDSKATIPPGLFPILQTVPHGLDFGILQLDFLTSNLLRCLHWGLLRNPGEAVHRTSELLGRDQFAFGGGDLQNVEGMWRSHPRVLELEDRLLACELGLQMAIRKKLEKPRKADWLTIYCRYFALQLIDGGEDRLEALLHREAAECLDFERIFIFDGSIPCQFFKSWSRPKPV